LTAARVGTIRRGCLRASGFPVPAPAPAPAEIHTVPLPVTDFKLRHMPSRQSALWLRSIGSPELAPHHPPNPPFGERRITLRRTKIVRVSNQGELLIRSINLSGTACFGANPVHVGPFGQVNFMWGPNGAGKTTLGRAIATPARFIGTALDTAASSEFSTRVYNRDYVNETFESVLPGVFILGEENVELHAEIAQLEAEIREQNRQRNQWSITLGEATAPTSKLGQTEALKSALTDAAWNKRSTVPEELSEMFRGTKNSKSTFLSRLLDVARQHSQPAEPFEVLKEEGRSALDQSATKQTLIADIQVPSPGAKDLLSVRVVGSAEVALATLIDKLRNADWVKAGREHVNHSRGVCPFCQQRLPNAFVDTLDQYFDAHYSDQLTEIERARQKYADEFTEIKAQLNALFETLSQYLPAADVQLAIDGLTQALAQNQALLDQKVEQPSSIVDTLSTGAEEAALRTLVQRANERIRTHNATVENRATAAAALIERCWQTFVRGSLSVEVARYEAQVVPLERAAAALRDKIDTADRALVDCTARLRALQRRVTSSVPVINEVNELLASVGFTNFKLHASTLVADGYELIRQDGSAARVDTLSEGERTFITFLYFYHELRGVPSASELADIVAIIDDPISSLDSDILFVVSSIVRQLMEEVVQGRGRVKQLFILTHNIHFHHEVAYQRHNQALGSRAFFTVRKQHGNYSVIDSHGSANPIQTAYKALWNEVRRAETTPDSANVGLQNILRRILENYFKVLGGVQDDEIVRYFSGQQQMVARSLFSWANDGSHTILDQLEYSPSGVSTAVYLSVFADIFQKSGHGGHYRMMMGLTEPVAA